MNRGWEEHWGVRLEQIEGYNILEDRQLEARGVLQYIQQGFSGQAAGLEKTVLAALTGWGQKEDRRRTSEAGFNHHLVKPPEPKAVDGVLSELRR